MLIMRWQIQRCLQAQSENVSADVDNLIKIGPVLDKIRTGLFSYQPQKNCNFGDSNFETMNKPNTRKQDALDYHSNGGPGKIQVVPTKPTNSQRDLDAGLFARCCRTLFTDCR